MLASVETLILYSSVYFAGLVLCGDLMQCDAVLGPLAPHVLALGLGCKNYGRVEPLRKPGEESE